MGRMNKITEKEKRLLLILITVLILVGSYQFGYQRFHSMASELESSNQELTGRLIELQQKQAKKQKMIDETIEYKTSVNTILEQFPQTLTQEKNIIFVTELEQHASIKVDSIAFNEMILFYTPDGVPTTDTATSQTDVLTETENSVQEESDIQDEVAENNLNIETKPNENTAKNTLSGYESTIILTYQATYEGLKKAIDFINTYHEKRHISDITASFDMTTGNLSGTISVVLYEADGGKDYEAPVLDNIGTGKDNIFGTFEN
ncbi:MAG: hypothetical protein K0S61_4252 [Anaerocolumna sp.]|nr:hypothetical protein [Anaerocolumna sp.]